MVADINGTAGSYIAGLTNVNGALYFVGYTSTNAYQIWHVNADGTVTMDTNLSGTTSPKTPVAMAKVTMLYFTHPGYSYWILATS
jgi:hypothetical protein